MNPLYSQKQFNTTKSNNHLKLKCYECNQPFLKLKKYIQLVLNKHKNERNNYLTSCKYCSLKCYNMNKIKSKNVVCLNCSIEFKKNQHRIKKSPNHFCSKSCAATYNNKHKSKGSKRSKLEIWLEQQLNIIYPNLLIHYNQKSIINSELDIYIPFLSLAFELNGIFHYEPIYGSNKLVQIQENDSNKFKSCIDANVNLCIIDTSQQKYFKESTSKKYLDIITNIIKERLLTI